MRVVRATIKDSTTLSLTQPILSVFRWPRPPGIPEGRSRDDCGNDSVVRRPAWAKKRATVLWCTCKWRAIVPRRHFFYVVIPRDEGNRSVCMPIKDRDGAAGIHGTGIPNSDIQLNCKVAPAGPL
jgi:hypothetical protein